MDDTVSLKPSTLIEASIEHKPETYQGHIMGLNSQKILDTLHFLSAGVVSFARGLNDTPKIVGLLVIH